MSRPTDGMLQFGMGVSVGMFVLGIVLVALIWAGILGNPAPDAPASAEPPPQSLICHKTSFDPMVALYSCRPAKQVGERTQLPDGWTVFDSYTREHEVER